jgi:hypothetical protein
MIHTSVCTVTNLMDTQSDPDTATSFRCAASDTQWKCERDTSSAWRHVSCAHTAPVRCSTEASTSESAQTTRGVHCCEEQTWPANTDSTTGRGGANWRQAARWLDLCRTAAPPPAVARTDQLEQFAEQSWSSLHPTGTVERHKTRFIRRMCKHPTVVMNDFAYPWKPLNLVTCQILTPDETNIPPSFNYSFILLAASNVGEKTS